MVVTARGQYNDHDFLAYDSCFISGVRNECQSTEPAACMMNCKADNADTDSDASIPGAREVYHACTHARL